MKIINCEQHSYEWFAARLGKPSGSMFADFITSTGKLANNAAARRYLLELVAERLTIEPADHYTTKEMERGTELEPKARKWYSLATGRTVQQVGFMQSDCGRWGASPDGLCEDRGLEIKCPMVPAFMAIAASGQVPDDYKMQCQAGLWISGKARWDFVAWTDKRGLEPQIITVEPDRELHAAFDKVVPEFCDIVDKLETKMREQGHGYMPVKEELPSWESMIAPRTIG